jgi:hypothetical protein
VGMGVAMGLQEAICGRCAHREEKATVYFVQVNVPPVRDRRLLRRRRRWPRPDRPKAVFVPGLR